MISNTVFWGKHLFYTVFLISILSPPKNHTVYLTWIVTGTVFFVWIKGSIPRKIILTKEKYSIYEHSCCNYCNFWKQTPLMFFNYSTGADVFCRYCIAFYRNHFLMKKYSINEADSYRYCKIVYFYILPTRNMKMILPQWCSLVMSKPVRRMRYDAVLLLWPLYYVGKKHHCRRYMTKVMQ